MNGGRADLRLRTRLRRAAARAALPLLGAVLAVLAIVDVTRLARARALDAAIARPAVAASAAEPGPAGRDDAPELLFAQAQAAAQAGRVQQALALYQAAARDPALAAAAEYDIGNLHLREALALAARDALQQNPQPAELAKRHYRAALRIDPTLWPAKYNLERALRLAPEQDDDGPLPPPLKAERAATTMHGFTLGLP